MEWKRFKLNGMIRNWIEWSGIKSNWSGNGMKWNIIEYVYNTFKREVLLKNDMHRGVIPVLRVLVVVHYIDKACSQGSWITSSHVEELYHSDEDLVKWRTEMLYIRLASYLVGSSWNCAKPKGVIEVVQHSDLWSEVRVNLVKV